MTKVVKTVDAALIFGNAWLVLIERAKPPFADKLVLPGGHVEKGEEFLEAVAREIKEEVGLDLRTDRFHFLTTLANPNRDPRGSYVSTVFAASISDKELKELRSGSDAKTIHLVPLKEIRPEMIGFDHFEAIEILKKR